MSTVVNLEAHKLESLIDELVAVKEKVSELTDYKRELEHTLIEYLKTNNAVKSQNKTHLVTLRNGTPKQRVTDLDTIQEAITKENKAKGIAGTDKEITIDKVGNQEVKLSLTKINTLNKFGLLTNAKELWFEATSNYLEVKPLK